VPTHTGKVQIVLVIWDRSRSAGSQNGWAKESAATEIYTVQMTRISAVIIITRPTQPTTQIAERTPNIPAR